MYLYPVKFEPILKDKIWGGQKLSTLLGKDFKGLPNSGESWEISSVPGEVSVVANGHLKGKSLNEIIREYKGDLVGHKVYSKYGDQFPLLIKFIDANDNLSVQVHPDDRLAKTRHNSFGKTEMWYVVQADRNAKLISGFDTQIEKDEYKSYVESGRIMNVLAKHEVSSGDVFFIPAGRIHAIGAGILIAEIQQTSDVTYRIYDFDRKDHLGNTRELHINEAIEANDYSVYGEYKTSYEVAPNEAINIVECEYFTTNVIDVKGEQSKDYSHLDSFVIYVCVEGEVSVCKKDLGEYELKTGETLLLPARIKTLNLNSKGGKLLEVYL